MAENWTPDLTKLCKSLAELYLEEPSIRRIADEAGMNSAFLTFSGNAVNNWHELILKAEAQDLVGKVIEAAMAGFPTNETLKEMLGVFKARKMVPAPAGMPAEPTKPISDPQLLRFISDHFSTGEIGNICFNLAESLRQAKKIPMDADLDIETFSSKNEPKETIAREMVKYFGRRKWTSFLVAAVKAERSDLFREKFGE